MDPEVKSQRPKLSQSGRGNGPPCKMIPSSVEPNLNRQIHILPADNNYFYHQFSWYHSVKTRKVDQLSNLREILEFCGKTLQLSEQLRQIWLMAAALFCMWSKWSSVHNFCFSHVLFSLRSLQWGQFYFWTRTGNSADNQYFTRDPEKREDTELIVFPEFIRYMQNSSFLNQRGLFLIETYDFMKKTMLHKHITKVFLNCIVPSQITDRLKVDLHS